MSRYVRSEYLFFSKMVMYYIFILDVLSCYLPTEQSC